MVENETLGTLHDDVAGADPQRAAIIDGTTGETLTYGDLAESVARVAGALDATSLSPGERVPLCYPNRPRFVVLFLAICRTGAVPVPVNLHSTAGKSAISSRTVTRRS
nr:class I adenylate-forming enzyme family protein [Halomicroarcula sp. SYNS111]